MQEIPDFASAVMDFQKFFVRQGAGTNIVWFFREDIAERRSKVWLRWPLPEANLRCAEAYYERGRQIGIGVQLCAHCRAGDKVCCWVNIAENDEEASWQMLYGLKLTVSIKMPQASPVQKAWRWQWVRIILRDRALTDSFPSKRAI